eukprot:921791-Amphidinium_carterae.1
MLCRFRKYFTLASGLLTTLETGQARCTHICLQGVSMPWKFANFLAPPVHHSPATSPQWQTQTY